VEPVRIVFFDVLAEQLTPETGTAAAAFEGV